MVYFGIISLVCKENKKELTGKAQFSATFLKQKLHISSAKLEKILRFCEEKDKLLFRFSEKKFNLEIPKILEIKDNYTKDLQVTSKNVSKQTEAYTKEAYKEETEEEYKAPPPRRRVEVDRSPEEKPCVQDCLTHYESEYLRLFEKIPQVFAVNDSQKLRPILEKRGFEETNFLITRYLEIKDDEKILKAGYPLCLFPSAINKIINSKKVILPEKKKYVGGIPTSPEHEKRLEKIQADAQKAEDLKNAKH